MHKSQSILLLLVITFSSAHAQDFIPYAVKIPGVERSIKMIPVAGGTYEMGSQEGEAGRRPDEGPRHEVSVSDFWMAEMEITWDQYDAFVYTKLDEYEKVSEEQLDRLGIDGLSGATVPYAEMSFGMGKEGYPAVNMTQYAALMYCKWLSAVTGEFYRLPTEAEWEYACKAGNDAVYSYGNDPSLLAEHAVFGTERYELTGSRKPGSLGIYDLNGNVAEWTMDMYDPEFYSRSKSKDPWLVPDKLYPRVARGGSWKQGPEEARCSARMPSQENWKRRDPQLPKSLWWHTNAEFVGFRVVRPFPTPSKKEIEKYWLQAIKDYGQ